MNRGIVILAQNTDKVNYIENAELLAQSITKCMPNLHLTLVTDDIDDSKYFDNVVALPYGDLSPQSDWKLINDWQVYEATPYKHTIKLEADLFITQPFDYWWSVLQQKDVVISTKIRNFKQEISTSRFYRKFIDDNNLPDVYNAITYFKKSELAKRFFEIVKDVFYNWDHYKNSLKCNTTEQATTDWAYAIACHILGVENTTISNFDSMSMIHMKQHINNLAVENWEEVLVYEINKDVIRVNTYPQLYPFHYHIKSFHKKLSKAL